MSDNKIDVGDNLLSAVKEVVKLGLAVVALLVALYANGKSNDAAVQSEKAVRVSDKAEQRAKKLTVEVNHGRKMMGLPPVAEDSE